MTKRTLDLIYAVAWIFGATALIWTSSGNQFENSPISRDPSWFPQMLLILILIAGVVLALRSFLRGSTAIVKPLRWQALIITLFISSAYLYFFFSLGFIPATVVFIPLMSWLLGYRRPLVIMLVTASLTIGLWYAFALLLNVTPPGIGLPIFR